MDSHLVDARRNLKLTVEYDGTSFHGWQIQPGVRTVQGTLIGALTELLGEDVALQGASRTDRGVHASGQVAHIRTDTPLPLERFARAANGRLPSDVRVRSVEEVSPDFHARFSARGKHYRYVFDRREMAGVFLARWALHYPGPLDVSGILEAAAVLVGEHDFAAFQCNSHSNDVPAGTEESGPGTVRTLYHIGVREGEGLLALDFWGRSFLYKMVRTLAGSLLEVGRGKWDSRRLRGGLESRQRERVGPTLPPQGLRLVRVYYDSGALETDVELAVHGKSTAPLGPWK